MDAGVFGPALYEPGAELVGCADHRPWGLELLSDAKRMFGESLPVGLRLD